MHHKQTHRVQLVIITSMFCLDGTWTLPRVSLMCCGSAGCRGMARTPSALSNQPSIEPMSSCSSVAAVRASADLQEGSTKRAKEGETCFKHRNALVEERPL